MRTRNHIWSWAAAFVLFAAAAAQAGPSITVLHSLTGDDGSQPRSLLVGLDGNVYGVARSGGSPGNHGSAFRMAPDGTFTKIVTFDGANGSQPNGITLGSDGNLYGTTLTGGASNMGTVFRITPTGALTTLHSFDGGASGSYPGELAPASDGYFYGTAASRFFRISPSGSLTVLGNTCCPSRLTQANDGNFYATEGIDIVRLTSSGAKTTIRAGQAGDEGFRPWIIQGKSGLLYTAMWDSSYGGGALLHIGLDGSQAGYFAFYPGLNTIGADIREPLVEAPNGVLYGLTATGTYTGEPDQWFGPGALFKAIAGQTSEDGPATLLASFDDALLGVEPRSLVLHPNGSLYGAAEAGGASGQGTLVRFLQANLTTLPTSLTTTALITVSPLAGKVHLNATGTLAEMITGKPVVARNVVFTSNGKWLCAALTTADGTAKCTSAPIQHVKALSQGVAARFAGDSSFDPSNASGPAVCVGWLCQ
jgi:uncharacterized repeat protein (TIGR03803 family)